MHLKTNGFFLLWDLKILNMWTFVKKQTKITQGQPLLLFWFIFKSLAVFIFVDHIVGAVPAFHPHH